MPNVALEGSTGVYQHNLAALGFGPGVLDEFAKLFGFPSAGGISLITKDTLTDGRIHFSELVSLPVIAGCKAAGAAERSAHFAKMSARGEVVQQVATAYLHAIAAASEVDNAKALDAQDQVLLDHAHAAHEAGTVANLDELRARVQLQSQQQALITAQNSLRKRPDPAQARDRHRLPARRLPLTDPAPYSDLAARLRKKCAPSPTRTARTTRTCRTRPSNTRRIHAAYRSQRLPTLSFNGYYARRARLPASARTAIFSPRAP